MDVSIKNRRALSEETEIDYYNISIIHVANLIGRSSKYINGQDITKVVRKIS
jgi:hypothetical protein